MFSESAEPEHRRQLRKSVVDFARVEASSAGIRSAKKSADGFCRIRWRKIADLYWTALFIPEANGGLGLAHGDLAALHQEVGRCVMPEPLVTVPLLAAQALVLGDNPKLVSHELPGLLSGERFATLAWQGGAGSLGAEGIGPIANRTNGGWSISGNAKFVPLPDTADHIVVAARTEAGPILCWTRRESSCSTERMRAADGMPFGTLHFDEVAVADSLVISDPGNGEVILEEVLDNARLAICAELLGAMEQTFTMTLSYLQQREQFGRQIGSFQALQHRAVDLFIQIELARSALTRAIENCEARLNAHDRSAAISAAKSRCADAALFVAKYAIQLHGAIAYTEEYDLSLYIRRILAMSGWLGNAAAHRARYGRLDATRKG